VLATTEETAADRAKYGRLVGDITSKNFGVSGTVYAVDHSKLFIKRFSYNDGDVDVFFYIENKGVHGLAKIDYPAEDE
jgi:Electron transfer DM13